MAEIVDIGPISTPDMSVPVVVRATRISIAEVPRCDLCDDPLGGRGHRLVSPHDAFLVVVCRTCRRAALSEGYRPDD